MKKPYKVFVYPHGVIEYWNRLGKHNRITIESNKTFLGYIKKLYEEYNKINV